MLLTKAKEHENIARLKTDNRFAEACDQFARMMTIAICKYDKKHAIELIDLAIAEVSKLRPLTKSDSVGDLLGESCALLVGKLEAKGVITIGDLCRLSTVDLYALKNVSDKTVLKVEKALANIGLRLSSVLPAQQTLKRNSSLEMDEPLLPEKITFRPCGLAGPMAKRLVETGERPSEYVRRLIAVDCGVESPEIRVGNPEIAGQSAAGVVARWQKRLV